MTFSKANGALIIEGLLPYPVSVHWSLLLGIVFAGNFSFSPGYWLGAVILIFAHVLGHIAVVRYFGGQVLSAFVHGFGGECRCSGASAPRQRAMIAWGGVAAQCVILLLALLFLAWHGVPQGWFWQEVLAAFLVSNLVLMVINLLPVAPLDGEQAWKLPGILKRERLAKQLRVEQQAAAEQHRAMLKEQDGPIEISSNVVDLLQKAAERSKKRDQP